MNPLTALPLGSLQIGALRSQDEVRQLSCFCREDLTRSGEDSEDRLRRVAASFEAIFARQLLREMRSSVLDSSLFGEGVASEIYQEMFDDHLAEAIGKAGGLGFGDLLMRQLQPEGRRLTPEEAIQVYEKQKVTGPHRVGQVEGEK